MKARYWSLAIVLFLVNYLIFSTLFTWLLNVDFGGKYPTRTPVPTFTPAPALPSFTIPTLTPIPVAPTPTATRVIVQPEASSGDRLEEEIPAVEAAASQAQLVAPGTVNIRSGPGLDYEVIGALSANTTMPITGRNGPGSWWQLKIAGGATGWVAASVVNATNTDAVPVVDAPPAPVAQSPASVAVQPASDSPPPQKPRYQYEPTGWYDDGNAGLTRFLGDIKDVNGNPVNGVFVQASCGDFSTISMPSGPVGWGPLNESADWPAGFYDVVVASRPVPCIWTLTVVETNDRETVIERLSESIPVEITMEKSIVTANWRKNW